MGAFDTRSCELMHLLACTRDDLSATRHTLEQTRLRAEAAEARQAGLAARTCMLCGLEGWCSRGADSACSACAHMCVCAYACVCGCVHVNGCACVCVYICASLVYTRCREDMELQACRLADWQADCVRVFAACLCTQRGGAGAAGAQPDRDAAG